MTFIEAAERIQRSLASLMLHVPLTELYDGIRSARPRVHFYPLQGVRIDVEVRERNGHLDVIQLDVWDRHERVERIYIR